MDLHAVIINKNIPLQKAQQIARQFIPVNKKFYRVTENSYRFRNLPKTLFEKYSYRSKKINDNITLVYGILKPKLEGF